MKSAFHVSLNVSDLPRSVEFYSRLFGDPAKRKPGYAKFVSPDPALHLALQEGRGLGGPGPLSHLGIRVESPEELGRWKDRLSARGLSGEQEKETVCCYARQDKLWLTDPDGNRWEVYAVLEDVETAREDSSACCEAQEARIPLR